MKPFDLFFQSIAKWEGDTAERPKAEDSGGLTRHGVTIGAWTGGGARIVGKPATREGLMSITWEDAKLIAKKMFWDKYKIDSIRNPALRILAGAAYWGSGGLGLKSMGYASIKDLNRDVFATPRKLYNKRIEWLKKLSNWKYNGKGWTNRLDYELKLSQRIQRRRLVIAGAAVGVVTGGVFLYVNRKKIWR